MWTSGLLVTLLIPPQQTPTLAKHSPVSSTKETTPQICSFFPGTQTYFIFLRSVPCFVALPSEHFDTQNELSHHLVVIDIANLSTNSKSSTKTRKTNGLGDGQLIIWDYLIQLEPFHRQDTHTQSVPSTQANLWGFYEFWLLPAIKPPHNFI